MVEQIGKYVVSELIGHGGMADVYKVTNKGLSGFSKTLCIKRIRKEFVDRAEFVEMFETEARIASHLHHDNIVQVYDFGRDEKTKELYLVMEYINGLDLNSILEIVGDYGTVSTPFAIYVLERLLLALDYAHTLNVDGQRSSVIHRDISPHNILVSSSGSVKLGDFGIAKAKGLSYRDETRTGVLKGKLSYMSPEQASAGKMPITPASDLFSAGVVFWETLTCKQLFNATMEHLAWGAMKLDESLLSDRSEPLRKFIAGLLAQDPANRFSSADAALRALRRLGIRPCTKSDAAHYVNKCRRDIEQHTWITEFRSAMELKGSKTEHTERMAALTQRIKQAQLQDSLHLRNSGEYTAEGATDTDNTNSSTAVESPDVSAVRRFVKNPVAMVASVASVILVAFAVFWFASKNNAGEDSPEPPTDEKSVGLQESELHRNVELQESPAPNQQPTKRHGVLVRPNDKIEIEDEKDTAPTGSSADDNALAVPKEAPVDSSHDLASKTEKNKDDDSVDSTPPQTQDLNSKKRKKYSRKESNEEEDIDILMDEQFPLEVSSKKKRFK